MPLRLNVGLSKKIGLPDYGSLGASVNLELELDNSAANEPERLRQNIRSLFDRAKSSIDDELRSHSANAHQTGQLTEASPATTSGETRRRQARGATDSQLRAIRAIATRRGLDLAQLVASRFRLQRIEDLSLSAASTLIDELKEPQSADGDYR